MGVRLGSSAAEVPPLSVLQIPLASRVDAHSLGLFVNAIHDLYFFSLWLERAESQARGGVFPDAYAPTEMETLWVRQMLIGTPNVAEFRGLSRHLVFVSTFLAAVLGGPRAYVELSKGRAETENVRIDSRLKQLEIESRQLDLIAKAEELHRRGLISDEALRHKHERLAAVLQELEHVSRLVPADRTVVLTPERE